MSSKRVHFSAARISSSQRPAEQSVRKKEGAKKKRKAWDATVSDLTVHKLTQEQLERRHRSHQSRNVELAKHELYEKAKENYDLDSSGNLRPSPLATKGGGLMRSLQGKELHEVLAESDRALRVVKDMFGDDPMRYSCQPNVTVAPHIVKNKANLEKTLLESQHNGPPPTALASPGGIRDESLLELAPKKPALNELPSPQDCDESETGEGSLDSTLTPHTLTPQGRGYKPSLNLKRFQVLIAKEENRENIPPTQSGVTSDPSPKSTESAKTRTPENTQPVTTTESDSKSAQVPQAARSDVVTKATLSVHVPSAGGGVDTESLSGLSDISSIPGPHLEGGDDVTVESDTSVVLGKGTAPRPGLTDHPLHTAHKMTPTKGEETADRIHGELEDLEKVVHNLNKELQEYERSTSHTTRVTAPHPTNGTLTSITSSLLALIPKITHHLHVSEAQLKEEAEVRGHLLQTMSEQQNLMDALTSDVVILQKDNVQLKKELKEAQHQTSEQLLNMQKEISDLHKKLSTLALQSFQPLPPHTNHAPLWTSQGQRLTSHTRPSMSQMDHGRPVSTPSTIKPQSTKTVTAYDNTRVYATDTTPGKSIPLYSQSSPPITTVHTGTTLWSHSGSSASHAQPAGVLQTHTLTSAPAGIAVPSMQHVSSDKHVFGGLSSPYIQAQQSPLSYSNSVSSSPSVTEGMDELSIDPSLKPDPLPASTNSFQELTPDPSSSRSATSDFKVEGPPYKDVSTLDDSFAPPPPPLSVALQVPTLNTGLTAATHGPMGSTSGGLAFDVAGLLDSLGKMSTSEKLEDKSSSQTPTPTTIHYTLTASNTNPQSIATKNSTIPNPLPPHVSLQLPPSTTHHHFTQAPSESDTVTVTSQPNTGQGLQAPDLSLSLFSTGTEVPEHSLDVKQGQGMVASGKKHLHGDPKLAGHSQLEGKPKSGWFALTSHVSQ